VVGVLLALFTDVPPPFVPSTVVPPVGDPVGAVPPGVAAVVVVSDGEAAVPLAASLTGGTEREIATLEGGTAGITRCNEAVPAVPVPVPVVAGGLGVFDGLTTSFAGRGTCATVDRLTVESPTFAAGAR
jgi:hypothetical protein